MFSGFSKKTLLSQYCLKTCGGSTSLLKYQIVTVTNTDKADYDLASDTKDAQNPGGKNSPVASDADLGNIVKKKTLQYNAKLLPKTAHESEAYAGVKTAF